MMAGSLPSIRAILPRLGVQPGRYNRARCPIHHGKNRSSFTWDEARGRFRCFACGARGDRIDLVRQTLGVGFRESLAWLGVGVDGDRYPVHANPPEFARRQKRRAGLETWAKKRGRELRNDFWERETVQTYALKKLKADPEDDLGWTLLEIACKGKDQTEHYLELIDGSQADQLAAFRGMEGFK